METKKQLLFDVEERAARARHEIEIEQAAPKVAAINKHLSRRSEWTIKGSRRVFHWVPSDSVTGLVREKLNAVGFIEYQVGGATVRVLNTREALTRFRRNLNKLRAAYMVA